MSHKDDLKARWARMCRQHFRDATHCAVFFGVTEQTARNWMDEVCAPAGWVINLAWSAMPEAADHHLRLVVENAAAQKITQPIRIPEKSTQVA